VIGALHGNETAGLGAAQSCVRSSSQPKAWRVSSATSSSPPSRRPFSPARGPSCFKSVPRRKLGELDGGRGSRRWPSAQRQAGVDAEIKGWME